MLFRALLAAIVLPTVLALADPTPSAHGQTASYHGRLLFLDEGVIQQLNLATGERGPFLRPAAGVVTHLAVSPDQRRLAYSVNRFDPGFRLLGSDLLVANADGSDPRPVVQETEEGYTVGWMSWEQDPNRLAYAKVNRLRATERVEEVDLISGARSVLVEDGSAPAVSPAAPVLAYQRLENRKWGIWSLDRARGEHQQLVRSEWFDDVDYPRFSPDGQWLAFTAAGAGPSAHHLNLANFFRAQLAPPASAHDLLDALFDLWVVRPDGSDLHRVTQLLDLNPQIAWSPDGTQIASMGWVTLQIVDVASGQSELLSRPPGFAPLTWGE
jgi:Tol biopolymer transport system component